MVRSREVFKWNFIIFSQNKCKNENVSFTQYLLNAIYMPGSITKLECYSGEQDR